jgi:hypothetical protein
MDISEKDAGVIAVILKRFEQERWPRAQALKAKVDGGEVLNDADLAYLNVVLTDARHIMGVIERHPEYASLAQGVLEMYGEIMTKSQKNSG